MDPNQFENDIPSDALDAMADMAYEQRQAMMEELDEPIQTTSNSPWKTQLLHQQFNN